MKSLSRLSSKLTISAAIALSMTSFSAIASAQSVTQPGSYVGAGISLQSFASNPSVVGANLTGRYKFDGVPLSARSSVIFGNGGTSVVPTVSYDLPVGDRTNLYLGAGASFKVGGNSSLTGDQTAFALQPGVEVSLNRRVLLYSNAVIPFNGQTNGSAGTSLQAGVGVQF
ncbi:MAG: porin family protein [Pseudanabaenaceae cyanobacterium bins.39]|nr:porin family protein [Pseudanabaenaceae cyanobacterium bins.39]